MGAPFFLAITTMIVPQLLFTFATPSADHFLQCLQTYKFSNPPISKSLYTPQNQSFLTTLQSYIKNSRFNRSTTPKPLALVVATHYSHVQSAVSCARVSGIQLRIRSGGHDYEGLSYVSRVPFVVLDMNKLREVEVDVEKEVAWVQAGAILGELYYSIAKKSNDTLAFPAGICFTVGTGGHFSGGGYGTLMRKYGLSVDNIIDALVVDAKGRILSRSTMGEDLFWAIRGGGGASFAVVLSWKLRLVRVPRTVTVFGVTKMLEQGATDAVDQWQRVAHKMDPALFIRAQPQAVNATLGVTFIALYLGGAEELVGVVGKSFPLLGLELKDCREMTWAQSTLYWNDGSPKGTPLEEMLQRSSTPNTHTKSKSDYVKKPIPKKALEAIWKKLIELGPSVLMQLNPYGGRMSEISDDATPIPHRKGNLFKIQYFSYWDNASVEVESKYIRDVRELHNAFTPYVSMNPRGAFLNYRDIDVGTNANGDLGFASVYFKGNVKRLLKVKGEVDPHDLFKYEQSIPIEKREFEGHILGRGEYRSSIVAYFSFIYQSQFLHTCLIAMIFSKVMLSLYHWSYQ